MELRDRLEDSGQALSPGTLRWLSAAFIALVCFAVYYNSLSNGFVTDDADQIVNNVLIRDLRNIGKFFVTDVWTLADAEGVAGRSNYYRPLMYVFYALEYRLFGLSPFGYHLTNLAFHCGVSVLVFFVVSMLLEERRPGGRSMVPALCAALVFAVHPVHVETVSWIADITDVSCAFYTLLSVLLYMMSKKAKSRRTCIALSAMSFFIALLCKETALTLLLVIPVYELVVRAYKGREVTEKSYRSRIPIYAPYALAAVVYLAMRTSAIGGITQHVWHQEVGAYSFVLTDIWLYSSYVSELFFPSDLSYYHLFSPVSSLLEKRELLAILIAAVSVIAVLVHSRTDRAVLLGFVIFIVTLSPAFYIYALPSVVFTERYLYLPSFGFVFAIAATLDHYSRRRTVYAVLIAGISLTIFASSYSTICRNHVWKDNFTLYEDAVRKTPEAAMPQYNYGFLLAERGKIDEAIEHLRAAVKAEPGDYESHTLLGVAYEKKGMTEKAIKEYEDALALKPDYTDARIDLGTLYLQVGMLDPAIHELEMAVRQKPTDPRASNNLAVAYDAHGMTGKAILMYKLCLKFDPDRVSAHYNLAMDYAKTGENGEAVAELEIVLRLNPSLAPARAKLALLKGAGNR